VEEIIDPEKGSRCIIPARLGGLVVGQPFQAVVLTVWKAGPTEEGDKHREQSTQPFALRTSNSGHQRTAMMRDGWCVIAG
jgi:hypothetical protein